MADTVMERDFDSETGIWTATLVETDTIFTADASKLIPGYFDLERVPQELFGGAINRDLGDSIAGKKDDLTRFAAMDTRYKKLLDGTAQFNSGGGRTISPAQVVMRERLASAAFKLKLYKTLSAATTAVASRKAGLGEKAVFAAAMDKRKVPEDKRMALWDAAYISAADEATRRRVEPEDGFLADFEADDVAPSPKTAKAEAA